MFPNFLLAFLGKSYTVEITSRLASYCALGASGNIEVPGVLSCDNLIEAFLCLDEDVTVF